MAKDVFAVMLGFESQLERARYDLANRRDFTLKGAFNYFANSSQYKLSLDEFRFGLDRLNINVDPRYVICLFNRYDSDQDGRIGFWEFSNALLPIEPRMREDVEARNTAYDMSYETREKMITLLRRCLDVEIEIERTRARLKQYLSSNLRQVFEAIDWLNQGFITKPEIKRVVEMGLDFVEDRAATICFAHLASIEMEALVRRFNKDKLNGKISMIEFVDELTQKVL